MNPIAGTGSLRITVNSYGRVIHYYAYGYGSGPRASSVTLTAKLRRQQHHFRNVVNVYLSLDTEDRQLQYVFPQFSLNDTGTIKATVDSVHFYVVQPEP